MDDDVGSKGGEFGCGFLVALLIVWMFWGIGKNGKYEGQTAEDWFNEFDYCVSETVSYQSCVEENFPNADYYCSQ